MKQSTSDTIGAILTGASVLVVGMLIGIGMETSWSSKNSIPQIHCACCDCVPPCKCSGSEKAEAAR